MPLLDKDERDAARDRLTQIAVGFRRSSWLAIAARLGIADLLKDGPKSGPELATAVNAQPVPLTSVMRGLAGLDVFRQQDDGRFALAPIGELLCSDDPSGIRGMILWLTETSYAVYASLMHTVKTGEPAFEKVMGMGVYEYRSKNEGTELILGAMSSRVLTGSLGPILAAYDFSRLKHVVDVGGGRGALLGAVLKTMPHLTGVLVERETNAAEARKHFEAEGLGARAQAVVGDILDALPGRGDCYIMTRVISNFSDALALRILQNAFRAMTPNGRVIVIDQIMPARVPGGGVPYAVELDINSQAHLGGRVRSEAEFRTLFEAAGLAWAHALPIEPTRYDYFVIEANRAA